MKESINWLKLTKKSLSISVSSGNCVDCAVKVLSDLDDCDKYGYIKSALADDPVMLQHLSQGPIPEWLLDEHKGELREHLEEALSYWYFDQNPASRDDELTAIFCFAILDSYCQFKETVKAEPGSSEEIILMQIDSSKGST